MAKRKSAPVETAVSGRISVDWKYTLFYLFFYGWLVLIALFGIIAEV